MLEWSAPQAERVCRGRWRGSPTAAQLGIGSGNALPSGRDLLPIELNRRCRPHLKPTNKSYRTDETYIKVKGEDKYLYRAVDSTGQTIDFLLTAKRDAAAAKRFFRKALSSPGNPVPRVINVDKNPAFPPAVEALKADGTLPRRVRLRQCGVEV